MTPVLCDHDEYVEVEVDSWLVRRCRKCDAWTASCFGQPAPLPPWQVTQVTSDDPLCECGHPRSVHHGGRGECMHSTETVTWACMCHEYAGYAPLERVVPPGGTP